MNLKSSSVVRARRRRQRRGALVVLAAFMIVAMVVIVGLAVDLGYVQSVDTELQRAADAAALAAAWDLIDDEAGTASAGLTDEIALARSDAVAYAALNRSGGAAPLVDPNAANAASGDVVVGFLADPSDPNCAMSFANPNSFNAATVRIRRTSQHNGQAALFFGRILGLTGVDMQAEATAALLNNIGGFRAPPSGQRLDLLPFALDLQTWNALLAGGGGDSYSWNVGQQSVLSGGDGIREVNLYPQGTGSPGNRGTVDIGSSNNSTNDIARQIVYGISASDLAHHGGQLAFDSSGKLYLNGDTGISAGVKDELASIIGQTRIIPIFSSVQGPGNNAMYTIVQFVGVRILAVKLTGSNSSKYVMVQPAKTFVWGGLPSTGTSSSFLVYSPVWLVR